MTGYQCRRGPSASFSHLTARASHYDILRAAGCDALLEQTVCFKIGFFSSNGKYASSVTGRGISDAF
jgi:hypothetical protein